MSARVIRNDLAWMMKERRRRFDEFEPDLFVWDTLNTFLTIRREAFAVFDQLPADHPAKLQALKEVRQAAQAAVDLVLKAPQFQRANKKDRPAAVTIPEGILSREDIDRITHALLVAQDPGLADVLPRTWEKDEKEKN